MAKTGDARIGFVGKSDGNSLGKIIDHLVTLIT